MKRTIKDMYASAYEEAINQVIAVINPIFGTNYTYRDNWCEIEQIAEKLGIEFDENGEIVKQ